MDTSPINAGWVQEICRNLIVGPLLVAQVPPFPVIHSDVVGDPGSEDIFQRISRCRYQDIPQLMDSRVKILPL